MKTESYDSIQQDRRVEERAESMDVMDGTTKSGSSNPLYLRTTLRVVTRKKREKQRELNE